MGKLLGPTALIFVKISRCNEEQRRNYSDRKTNKGIVRTNNAIVEVHIRGSLQTIDLTTGRIFSAHLIEVTRDAQNHSDDGIPEFPSQELVRDAAINAAAHEASTFFVKWAEQKRLYFFNGKECNLNRAFAMLKAGDIEGTVRQSEENVGACKSWPKVKDSNVAHAYYNAGLSYMLVNEHAKAISYLTESERLKGGDIVTQTIIQANRSAKLAVEMQSVTEKTEKFEQAQAEMKARAPQAPGPSGPTGARPALESVEERLKKLDGLFKKGLITKQEFEAKKTEILKDI